MAIINKIIISFLPAMLLFNPAFRPKTLSEKEIQAKLNCNPGNVINESGQKLRDDTTFKEKIEQARAILNSSLTDFPGISVAVCKEDEVLWSENFGYADIEKKEMPERGSVFRYYSLSKAITGAAIAKLTQNKKINPEDNLVNYLKDLPSHYTEVTIRQLLTHSGGVRHYKKGEWMKFSSMDCKSPSEALNFFINDALVNKPGDNNYLYSSFGYVLLSALIEKVAATSYEQYVMNEIFKPLNLSNIKMDSGIPVEKTVHFYEGKSGKFKESPQVKNSCKSGAGGWMGDAESLALFFGKLMKGSGILPPDYLKQVWPVKVDKDEIFYGFGLQKSRLGSPAFTLIHTGSGIGGSSFLFINLDTKMTFVFITNIEDGRFKEKCRDIVNIFLQ